MNKENEGINVLSLFDGMSCGMIALERAGIKVKNYYASEIDKHAIKVSRYNYPDIIQLGDVTKVSAENLPKIDLLIGGSPCQGFSMSGRQLNFNDPRSALFFEYLRLLNEIREVNPEVKFLLENVKMKREHSDLISELLGCEPVMINSKDFSAQSRTRYYWTNILVRKYEPKKVRLKDICPDASARIDAEALTNQVRSILQTSKYVENFKQLTGQDGRVMICRPDGLKIQRIGRIAFSENYTEILTTVTQPYICSNNEIRKATPVEAERLQTVPDNYTSCVSDSQRYKMLGNGWTVDVIAHILQGLK